MWSGGLHGHKNPHLHPTNIHNINMGCCASINQLDIKNIQDLDETPASGKSDKNSKSCFWAIIDLVIHTITVYPWRWI